MIPLVMQKGYVLFDEEELRGPKQPAYFFQNTRQTFSGAPKEHGVQTNLVGSGGSVPNGQVLDVTAVRVRVSPNEEDKGVKIEGSPRVRIRFAASESGDAFAADVKPDTVHELGKTLRFWSLENFCVEVYGNRCRGTVRVELLGDLHRYGRHSNVVSPEGDQLWSISERELKLLSPIVERAVAETTDKRDRMSLTYMLSTIRENRFTLDGSFHAAQLVKGDVSVVSFQTPDARDAYKKAFDTLRADGVVRTEAGRVLVPGVLPDACWKMPEDLETIADEGLKDRVLGAWRQTLARYGD